MNIKGMEDTDEHFHSPPWNLPITSFQPCLHFNQRWLIV